MCLFRIIPDLMIINLLVVLKKRAQRNLNIGQKAQGGHNVNTIHYTWRDTIEFLANLRVTLLS